MNAWRPAIGRVCATQASCDDVNGIETGTAGAGADDDLSVLDRDGLIDTGRDLFGKNTPCWPMARRLADG